MRLYIVNPFNGFCILYRTEPFRISIASYIKYRTNNAAAEVNPNDFCPNLGVHFIKAISFF